MASIFRRSNGVHYFVYFVQSTRIWGSTNQRTQEESERVAQAIFQEVIPQDVASPRYLSSAIETALRPDQLGTKYDSSLPGCNHGYSLSDPIP